MVIRNDELNNETMGELYTELHPKLVRHFLGKGVSNKEAAEDLASESLWDLRKYGDKPKEKLKRIIWGIAKNKAIDYFRDQKKIVLFGSAEEIEGKMIPEQLLVRPVERSGRSPIKEDDRIKKVFDEIIKSWGSLDEMRLFLTSPHREIQLITLILQADIESRGVLLSGLRKQLGLRKTGYKKDILINDVYDIPGKSTVEKVPRAARRVLYLRKALGRRSYNRLSQRIYAFLAAAGFCKQVVLIKRITGRGHTISKFPSYIGFTGMLAVLFLDNPRPALETMIGPVEKSNTYSKDFFRDYFFYLFWCAGVKPRGMKEIAKFLLDDTSAQHVENSRRSRSDIKAFVAKWYTLEDLNSEVTKKQLTRMRNRIKMMADIIRNFSD